MIANTLVYQPLYRILVCCVLALLAPRFSYAAPPVKFSKEVLPLLRAQCWSCHSGNNPASGYSLETREKLLAGGRHGTAVTLGKGAQSSLVQFLTGERKPKMPPKGAIDLEKIAVLRRWIDEGAKVDSMVMPDASGGAVKPAVVDTRAKFAAPVTALALSPDGKLLAVGGYNMVRLLDPTNGELKHRLPVALDQIQSLAWNQNGQRLAVAGGAPGRNGEAKIFNTSTWQPMATLTSHSDVLYSIAFRPNSNDVVTASLDKTIRIWNADSGNLLRTIKDHADAVFGIAFSSDGKFMASASGDRTAKIFQTSDWKRVATLNAHQDALTRAVFHPSEPILVTIGADKTARVWKLEIGKMENPLRQMHAGDLFTDAVFSPDGNLLLIASADQRVRVFNKDGSQVRGEWSDLKDWVYSVAATKDGTTVIAGGQEGRLLFWNLKENRLVRTLELLPSGTRHIGGEEKK